MTTHTGRFVVRHLDNEVVVYDTRTDKAHLLNPTSSAVWESWSPEASLATVASDVAEQLGVPVSVELVEATLDELAVAGLIERPSAVSEMPGISRRSLLKKAGIAAVLLPAVTTILAPTPAAASHTGGLCAQQNQPCDTNSHCCSNTCTGNTCVCTPHGTACPSVVTECCGTCVSGICQPLANGATCQNTSQCAAADVCSGGECCRANGNSCTATSQCCGTDVCGSGGVCRTCIASGSDSQGAAANCCTGQRSGQTCCNPDGTLNSPKSACCSGKTIGGTSPGTCCSGGGTCT